MKRFEIFFGIIKIPLDFVMTVGAFLAAYQLRQIVTEIKGLALPIDYTVFPTTTEYMHFGIGAAISLVIIFALGKMYALKITMKFSEETKKSLVLCIIWAMFIITYFFFTRTFPFSRLAILYSWTLTFIFITTGRAIVKIIQKIFLKSGIGNRKLIFIGNNEITNEITENIFKDSSYKIIGVIGENKKTKLKYLGSFSQLKYIIETHETDEIIQTIEANSEEILEMCDTKHINYRFVPNLIDVRRTNIEIETINSIPIIALKPTPLEGWGNVIKRAADIIGSILGFIIFSPIFIITAIAIKLDSKGPILFTKLDDGLSVKRIGLRGKSFKFYKFRSMYPKTDNLRYTKLAEKNIRKDGPLIKIENDPRITKVGKFIRKYSIDELPQLWNVLKGDMSLVGPRPHLPEEVAKYQDKHRFILTIKPGLTGLPQISGRSDLKFDDEIKLDRYYIENWSTWFDLKIIFKTIGIILKGYRE